MGVPQKEAKFRFKSGFGPGLLGIESVTPHPLAFSIPIGRCACTGQNSSVIMISTLDCGPANSLRRASISAARGRRMDPATAKDQGDLRLINRPVVSFAKAEN